MSSNLSLNQSTIKIILIIIIKNESAIIRRCLNSLLTFVDGFCICDTGSTDNTLEILEEYHRDVAAPARKIFHVARHQWRNFGHNRSLSFTECRDWITADYPDWSLEQCWGLLLDADMVLRIENVKALRQLLQTYQQSGNILSQFQLLQKNRGLIYWNTRVIRMSYDWICRGVTHEYWESRNGGSYAKIMDDIVWIDDQNDGGSKADKFTRDARLLEDALSEPEIPEDLKVRYYFYLAQTYVVLRNIPKAIEYFNKRIEAGGWTEEIWYSHYQKFLITQSRDDLWPGIECMPQRLENIHAHFKNKRERGIKYTQEDFAMGSVGYSFLLRRDPHENYLFMEQEVYKWRFMDEFSLVCYYTDHKKEGKEITDKLLEIWETAGIDVANYARIQQNRGFY